MIICPFGTKCKHCTVKRVQPSNVCWWFFLGWCTENRRYEGAKPE